MKQNIAYDIDAVAFDIDGTLYPSWKFTFRGIPFFIRHLRFMYAFRKVRQTLHDLSAEKPDSPLPDFFGLQSQLLAQKLPMTPEQVTEFVDKSIYKGWKKYFIHMKPYPYAKEVIEQLKDAGLKIGILSDFPPDQKDSVWDILPLCDASLGSEDTGALKPSHIPFKKLAEMLGVPCERILYVGNSQKYDIEGAAAVGMKTACIQSHAASLLGKKIRNADISFSNYRQLLKNVLK